MSSPDRRHGRDSDSDDEDDRNAAAKADLKAAKSAPKKNVKRKRADIKAAQLEMEPAIDGIRLSDLSEEMKDGAREARVKAWQDKGLEIDNVKSTVDGKKRKFLSKR